MTESLRIAIAEDEPELLADLGETLAEFGHTIVATAANGRVLVERCCETTPELVITDIKMPDMDGLEAARKIRSIRPTPVVIVSAFPDDRFVKPALEEHVLAYLVKPLNPHSLKAPIALAMQRFREFQVLREQAADLHQALEDRKFIERAKGILMQRAQLTEPDAFKRLQLLSSQKNKKMADVARMLVEADSAFQE